MWKIRACIGFVLVAMGLTGAKKPAELNLTDVDGRKVHLRDYRGKIVVLNFWATWCGPCKEEMPMLVAAEKEWSAKGVVFIGVSLDERSSQKKISEFLKTLGVGFAVWKGATNGDLAALGLHELVPDTVFVDEEGGIFSRVEGQIKRAELIERLEWVTGDRKGAAPKARVRNF